MKIYISSSWRNQHAVEMLTKLLRDRGHSVKSWIENNFGEFHNHVTKKLDFETWVNSKESDQSFAFDITGAMDCDLHIYVSPGGVDCAVEIGASFAKAIPVIALMSKGDQFGLMRKVFKHVFTRYVDLISYISLL